MFGDDLANQPFERFYKPGKDGIEIWPATQERKRSGANRETVQ
jgi:hypothetical protein